MDLGKKGEIALLTAGPRRAALGHAAGRQVTGAEPVLTLRGDRQSSAAAAASLQAGM